MVNKKTEKKAEKEESKTPSDKEDSIILSNEEKEKQSKKHNRIIKGTLVLIIIALAAIFLWVSLVNSIREFQYKGLDFKVVKQGDLILYNTVFPIYSEGKQTANYNIYLRNDPRDLETVPINGTITLLPNIVVDTKSDNFTCQGYDLVAVGNFIRWYDILGVRVLKNENYTCSNSGGRYTFVSFKIANETRIDKIGNNCYVIKAANCEILQSTERFMVASLAEAKGYTIETKQKK